jgi:hypothetical protein
MRKYYAQSKGFLSWNNPLIQHVLMEWNELEMVLINETKTIKKLKG